MVAQLSDLRTKGDQTVSDYGAALVVSRESTPEAMLQCIVNLAREVVPTEYAALAVTHESGQIARFFSSGMPPEDQERTGRLPQGNGLLGDRTHGPGPLLDSSIPADPRSSGFPPGHPPTRTLLGTPIHLKERLFGSLYMSPRWDGQPFTADDAATVEIFATHAAETIDRALAFQHMDDVDVAAMETLKTYAAATIDRSLAYKRVEEQRDQLRIILDSLPAGVLILSGPDGLIELTNQALTEMLFGPTSPPETLPTYSRDVEMLRSDGTPLPHEQSLSCRALKGEAVRNQQLLLKSAGGQQVPVLVQAMPLPNASGEVERAVLVFQDITHLREAEQLKDDFLSLVSHEFRTPLTTIHGGAHLLMNQGEDLDPQTRRALLRDIVEESDRLDRMLANMLVLTDVMAGRLAAKLEPVAVEQLVRAAVTPVKARASNHTFALNVAPDLPPAEGDPALFAQVLSNLYQNAVKYSPAGGKIQTTVTCDGQTVSIAVSDQGIGVEDCELERVFDRFYRAGSDPSVRGTGLGLYLSRHLVNVQRGQIGASSPGPGKGATFTVTLPIAADWTPVSQEDEMALLGGE